MRQIRQILAALLAFSPFAANADLINFTDLPGGGVLAANTILTDQYADIGVTFSATEDGEVVSSAVFVSLWSDGNSWNNTTDSEFVARHDVMSMVFDSAVENVNWLTQTWNTDLVTFMAYDSYDILLETFSISGDWITTSFTVSNISRIDALQPWDGGGWALDNLSFDNVTSVPEPGTLALLSIGLFGMGLARRRRKV